MLGIGKRKNCFMDYGNCMNKTKKKRKKKRGRLRKFRISIVTSLKTHKIKCLQQFALLKSILRNFALILFHYSDGEIELYFYIYFIKNS